MTIMIAGVDGTRRGWVAVICNDDLTDPRGSFVPALIGLPDELQVVAVDIPIGLPDQGGREADRLARQELGEPRRRSVFPCPIRPSLAAQTWEGACLLTQEADGRRVSKQTFAIYGKVAEVDALMQNDNPLRNTLHEVHPELSFACWSHRPMAHRKKSPEGRLERQQVIAAQFGDDTFAEIRSALRGNGIGADDLADAFAAAWTASRILANCAVPFPAAPERDACGIAMQIWA